MGQDTPSRLSRRGFLGASGGALTAAGLGWMPMVATACAPSTAGPTAALPAPVNFPSGIALARQRYQNWSGEMRVDGVWTAAPSTPADVVRIARWASRAGYRVRARGAMHGWSPLTIVPGSDLSRVVLVDTRGLGGIAIDTSGGLPKVTAGAGVHMDDLLDTLGAAGLALASTPATGGMTVGGALAIDAHGAVAGAAGEQLPTGLGFGSISNQVIALQAVVWDPTSGQYGLRWIDRSDPQIGPLLTHLGRGFVTAVVLQVGAAIRVRCESFTDIGAAELFVAPEAARPDDRTFSNYLDQSGRIEAIWFAFTDAPWVKVWTPEASAPTGSRTVHGPYNYPFSDHVDPDLAQLVVQLVDSQPSGAPSFGALQQSLASAGLTADGGRDLWGWAHDLTRYIRASTLRMSEGGGAMLCRRADVQRLVSGFAAWHRDRLATDASHGRFPINGPVEVRCSGLDHPSVVADAAGPPSLSALRPRVDRPELDTAVWVDVLTTPGTPGAVAFYRDMEQWFLAAAAGGLGVFRPEWSKGWGYGATKAWSDPTTLDVTIPESFGAHGHDLSVWREALGGLDALDPARIYSNPFMDSFLP